MLEPLYLVKWVMSRVDRPVVVIMEYHHVRSVVRWFTTEIKRVWYGGARPADKVAFRGLRTYDDISVSPQPASSICFGLRVFLIID